MYKKINYKVKLSLKFGINILISIKNHVCHSSKDNGAHNGVEDKGARNGAEL